VDNDDIIAAILTAGMLPTLPGPSEPGTVSADERKLILGTIQHAIGLYAGVLEALRSKSGTTDYTGDRPVTEKRRGH
jgi:hypothetical protein